MLFILILEIWNRNLRQVERIWGIKIKGEFHKLRVCRWFAASYRKSFEGTETLMTKLKEFGVVAGFKVKNKRLRW